MGIKLKWISKKWDGEASTGSGQGQVAGACEWSNEPSGSIKFGNVLTTWEPVCLSARTLLNAVFVTPVTATCVHNFPDWHRIVITSYFITRIDLKLSLQCILLSVAARTAVLCCQPTAFPRSPRHSRNTSHTARRAFSLPGVRTCLLSVFTSLPYVLVLCCLSSRHYRTYLSSAVCLHVTTYVLVLCCLSSRHYRTYVSSAVCLHLTTVRTCSLLSVFTSLPYVLVLCCLSSRHYRTYFSSPVCLHATTVRTSPLSSRHYRTYFSSPVCLHVTTVRTCPLLSVFTSLPYVLVLCCLSSRHCRTYLSSAVCLYVTAVRTRQHAQKSDNTF
jgi:hypothetical protein